MDIRSEVVNGVRVFCLKDVAVILGCSKQSLIVSMHCPPRTQFLPKNTQEYRGVYVSGLTISDFKIVFNSRLKYNRVGDTQISEILKWMGEQTHLYLLPMVTDFSSMTPEEIFDKGLMDEFDVYVKSENARREAIEKIKGWKDTLNL